MTSSAPTTPSAQATPAGLPIAAAEAAPAAPGTTAPAPESASAPRARRGLRLWLARRTRLKEAGPARTGSSAQEIPNTPDVWLAGLRLGG